MWRLSKLCCRQRSAGRLRDQLSAVERPALYREAERPALYWGAERPALNWEAERPALCWEARETGAVLDPPVRLAANGDMESEVHLPAPQQMWESLLLFTQRGCRFLWSETESSGIRGKECERHRGREQENRKIDRQTVRQREAANLLISALCHWSPPTNPPDFRNHPDCTGDLLLNNHFWDEI